MQFTIKCKLQSTFVNLKHAVIYTELSVTLSKQSWSHIPIVNVFHGYFLLILTLIYRIVNWLTATKMCKSYFVQLEFTETFKHNTLSPNI